MAESSFLNRDHNYFMIHRNIIYFIECLKMIEISNGDYIAKLRTKRRGRSQSYLSHALRRRKGRERCKHGFDRDSYRENATREKRRRFFENCSWNYNLKSYIVFLLLKIYEILSKKIYYKCMVDDQMRNMNKSDMRTKYNFGSTRSKYLSLIFQLITLISIVSASYIGPKSCPDYNDIIGYSNVKSLRNDLQIRGQEFILCPKTTIDLMDGPLIIKRTMNIQCGKVKDNRRKKSVGKINNNYENNDCIIEGGSDQIIIQGNDILLTLRGLSFRNSTGTSVLILAIQSDVIFEECSWAYHTGCDVIFIGKGLPEKCTPPEDTPHYTSAPNQSPGNPPAPAYDSTTSDIPSINNIPQSPLSENVTPPKSIFPSSQIDNIPGASIESSLPSINAISLPSISNIPTDISSSSTLFPTSGIIPSSSINPSIKPSTSFNPSGSLSPSSFPSKSAIPSSSILPSTEPTRSSEEVSNGSKAPSTSSIPSNSLIPSVVPTRSQNPSVSIVPSLYPSLSLRPSLSSVPSTLVSVTIILSAVPSKEPTSSLEETLNGSEAPSVSLSPSSSLIPSAVPATSQNPSISNAPSLHSTDSLRPSLSSVPSTLFSGTTTPTAVLSVLDVKPFSLPLSSQDSYLNPSMGTYPAKSFYPSFPSKSAILSSSTTLSTDLTGSSEGMLNSSEAPSASLSPSNSVIPSMTPTTSQNPSISTAPSLYPTDSLQPSLSSVPSTLVSRTTIPTSALSMSEVESSSNSLPISPQNESTSSPPSALYSETSSSSLLEISSKSISPSVSLSPSESGFSSQTLPINSEPFPYEDKNFLLAETNSGTVDTSLLEGAGDGLMNNFGAGTKPLPTHLYFSNEFLRDSTESRTHKLPSSDSVVQYETDYSVSVPRRRKRQHFIFGRKLRKRRTIVTNVTFKNCLFMENTLQKSILLNNGSRLTFSGSKFTSNRFISNETAQHLVLSLVGSLNLSNTTFLRNPTTTTNVFVGKGSQISHKGNCGDETQSCAGVYIQTSGRCEEFAGEGCFTSPPVNQLFITVGPTAPSVDPGGDNECFRDWSSLTKAAEEKIEVLTLCANTTFYVIDSTSLLISTDKTVLKCGINGERGNNCIIRGGADQVVIKNPGTEILGINFLDSSRSSIQVDSSDYEPLMIRDCTFSEHKGKTVIIAYVGSDSILNEENIIDAKDISPPLKVTPVMIENCLFSDNVVSLAPILTGDGFLSFHNSVMVNNKKSEIGTIAALFNSKVQFSYSCLVGNEATKAITLIDDSSKLSWNEATFAFENNVEGGSCLNGVKLQNGECFFFSGKFCNNPLFDFNIFYEIISSCINDLERLKESLSTSNEVEICPGVEFELKEEETPLKIEQSDFSLKCGSDGSQSNDCKFIGGAVQIEIESSITNVTLSGITFVGAHLSAIVINASSPLQVEFSDCVWQRTKGDNTIVVSSKDIGLDTPSNNSQISALVVSDDDIFSDDDSLNDLQVFKIKEGMKQKLFEVSLYKCSMNSNEIADSLIFLKGGNLKISSCTFSSNELDENGKGLVRLTEASHLILSKSCFHSNNPTISQDFIEADNSSSLIVNSNYVSKDTDTFCTVPSNYNDLLCTGFNSSFCEAATTLKCYSKWESLSEAIKTANVMQEGAIFTLCEDSVIEVPDFSPLQLNTPDATIRCGSSGISENGCIIKGGTIQLQIKSRTKLQGITMKRSSIAAVHAIGEEAASLLIEDCIFSEHFGLAAVISYNGSLMNAFSYEERSKVENLQYKGNAMDIQVKSSIFVDQSVTFSPLITFAGRLVLNDITFSRNNGTLGAGIGVWHQGNLSLGDICFDEQVTTPNIFLDIDCIFDTSDIIAAENFDENCTDILHNKECFQLPTKDCNPFIVPHSCYDNWIDLGKAIKSPFSQFREERIFTICEGAILDTSLDSTNENDPISIFGTKNIVKCGKLGSQKCTIKRGKTHFQLEGTGETIFEGLIFEEAEFASIIANGQNSSFATFKNCLWQQNLGEAAIFIKPLDNMTSIDLLANETISDLVLSTGDGMTVLIDNCNLQNNTVKHSLIVNSGGHLNLVETVIHNNTESLFGIITALNGAEIGLSWSCFIENSAQLRGIIFLDQNSTLLFNGNTFGLNNKVLSQSCTEIFREKPGPSCAKLNENCTGECEGFESRTCRVSSFPFGENSTFITTNAPSQFSTLLPTLPKDDNNVIIETIYSAKPGLGGLAISGILLGTILIILLLGGVTYSFLSKKKENTQRSAMLEKMQSVSFEDDKTVADDGELPLAGSFNNADDGGLLIVEQCKNDDDGGLPVVEPCKESDSED